MSSELKIWRIETQYNVLSISAYGLNKLHKAITQMKESRSDHQTCVLGEGYSKWFLVKIQC